MESTPSKPSLSPGDYFSAFVAIIRIGAAALAASVAGIFRGSSGVPTYRKHVLYNIIKAFSRNLPLNIIQALLPSTTQAYSTFTKNNSLPSRIFNFTNGAYGCWIGDPDPETVLLWFHGGGYTHMATDGHFKLLSNVVQQAASQKAKLSALLVQYDLAPGAVYPQQLHQAASALRYLLEDMKYKPSQILLGGDSAGGNLALALLSHLSHPHPAVPELSIGENLNGVALLSPWVTFNTTSQSFKTNEKKDCLEASTLQGWSSAFMGSANIDEYNTPLSAPPEWWRDLPAGDVFVVAGSDEVFIDDIKEFTRILEVYNKNTELLIGENEAHDAPVVDLGFGMGGGIQELKFYQWVLDQLPRA